MSTSPKVISAPGKVFLAGGYLVLDRAYTALVFGLDARIHVHVQKVPTSEGVSLQEIVVDSPQFKGSTWRYGYHPVPEGGVKVTELRTGAFIADQPNIFVETALSYALTYITSVQARANISPASITILADNDYYSQQSTTASTSRFAKFSTPIWATNKTGLGSSAALVTALIGAVLVYYLSDEDFSLSTETGKRRLHNLAQAAHCAAQGKVGSGFDIASAVYGSCIYRRFSPSILEKLAETGSQGFSQRLKALVEETDGEQWDTEIIKSKVTIPKGLRLVMCDVDCGSKTPGMVKQVLQWRKQDPENAGRIWDALQAVNDNLAAELVRLAKETQGDDYTALREIIQENRKLVREMSERSGVPVEPEAQTKLLDACSDVEGVIGGVTPGAGGFDADVLLVKDDEETMDRLKDMLKSYRFVVGDEATTGSGRVGLLRVREEMEGVREEAVGEYQDWIR